MSFAHDNQLTHLRACNATTLQRLHGSGSIGLILRYFLKDFLQKVTFFLPILKKNPKKIGYLLSKKIVFGKFMNWNRLEPIWDIVHTKPIGSADIMA